MTVETSTYEIRIVDQSTAQVRSITIALGGMRREIGEVQRAQRGMGLQARDILGVLGQMRSGLTTVASVATGIVSAFAGVTAGIAAMGAGIVASTLRLVEMREAAVTTLGVTMGGRGEREINNIGGAALRQAQAIARQTPINLAEAVEAQQQVAGGFRVRDGTAAQNQALQQRMLAAFTDVRTLRGATSANTFLTQMGQLRNSARPTLGDMRPIANALGMSVLDIRTESARRAGIVRQTGETDFNFERRVGQAERSGRITGESASEAVLSLLTQRTGMGLGGFAERRGTGLGAAMSNFAEIPENIVATIAGIESTPGIQALARVLSQIAETLTGTGESAQALQRFIVEIGDSFGTSVADFLTPARMAEGFRDLLGWARQFVQIARTTFRPLLDGLREGFAAFGPVVDQGTSFSSVLQSVGRYAPEMARGLGLVVGFAAQVVVVMGEATGLFLIFINRLSMIPEALGVIWNAITSAFSGIGDFFVSIGSDVVSGLVNGITGNIGQVWEAVTSLAQGIPAAARDALGIRSPSRVMQELGGYTAEGFALGIEGGAGDAQDAMRAMVAPPAVGGAAGLRAGPLVGEINVYASGGPEGMAESIRVAVIEALTDTLDRAAMVGA